MTELVEQTKIGASNSQKTEYLIYYFFGALEALLAFRLIFKLAGASLNSGFVRMIYGLTGIFCGSCGVCHRCLGNSETSAHLIG